MSQEAERVYTINLGKVLLSQSQHRAVRAINMIREFAQHHMKSDDIKIDEALAQEIWARGVRRPPRKIRVKMGKFDDGYVLVSLYDEVELPPSSTVPDDSTPKVLTTDVIEGESDTPIDTDSSKALAVETAMTPDESQLSISEKPPELSVQSSSFTPSPSSTEQDGDDGNATTAQNQQPEQLEPSTEQDGDDGNATTAQNQQPEQLEPSTEQDGDDGNATTAQNQQPEQLEPSTEQDGDDGNATTAQNQQPEQLEPSTEQDGDDGNATTAQNQQPEQLEPSTEQDGDDGNATTAQNEPGSTQSEKNEAKDQ